MNHPPPVPGAPRPSALSRRSLIAGAATAAVGAALLAATDARAQNAATPTPPPLGAPPPPVPLAAGGGVPRVVQATLDGLAGAGQPAIPGLELVAALDGPLLVGVAVSAGGRIFLNWPRWGDPVAFTVGELRGGEVVPFLAAAVNRFDPRRPGETLVSVQAMAIDAEDRLWLLDTGSVNFGPVVPGGAKVVAVDLATDRIVQTIPFPEDVARRTSSVNDIRFDLGRGEAGMAFVTDAAPMGPNGIITVDLASGRS